MKASLHSIFWILLTIGISFLLAYVFTKINLKETALLTRNLKATSEKSSLAIYDVSDVSILETSKEIKFNLINLGADIKNWNWYLSFLDETGKSKICTVHIFTGNPATEAGAVSVSVYIPSRNITYDNTDPANYGWIYNGETAEVDITLVSACPELFNYTRENPKIMMELTIGGIPNRILLKCKKATTEEAAILGASPGDIVCFE